MPKGLTSSRHANVGLKTHEVDAETTPLRHPEHYKYDIDVAQVAEVWRRGSVVASWLLDLTASALRKSPDLENFAGRVSDSGEGRWTLQAAIDESVPAPVIRRRCSPASARAARTITPIVCSRRCDSSLADIVEKPKDEH